MIYSIGVRRAIRTVFKNVKTFWMIEMAARRENPYINKNNGLDPLTLEKISNNTK